MIFSNKLSRKKFILTVFGGLFFYSFIESKKINNRLELTKDFKSKVNSYNSKRLTILKTDLKLAIKDDLSRDKTVWIGKKLYTFAEIFLLLN